MLANQFLTQMVIAVFAGLLVAVAIADVRRMEIPNRYSLAITLLYPLHVISASNTVDWRGGLIVGAVALVIGFVLFAFRFAGGGDAKFFAASALWAGPDAIALLTFVTALVGGIVGLVLIFRRWLTAPARPKSTVPLPARMAAAIAVFFGKLLMPRVGHASTGPSVDSGGPGSEPSSLPPVGTLPYGVAICAGGLVIAAILFTRG